MARKASHPEVSRRKFLAGAAVAGAAASTTVAQAATPGKPQMMLCHGTVGLQHAVMSVYNAWVDRVPVILVGGNDLDAAHRPPGVPTVHSAQDINAMVRDFTKWDDQPVSAQHFAQSFVRAYKMAMTPPYGPVMISLDAGLQDMPVDD